MNGEDCAFAMDNQCNESKRWSLHNFLIITRVASITTTMAFLFRFVIVVIALSIGIQLQLRNLGVSPVSSPIPELLPFEAPTIVDLTGKVETLGDDNNLPQPESLIPGNYKGKEYLFLSLGDGRIVRFHNDDDSWKDDFELD